MQKHIVEGVPLTLAENFQGYLLDGYQQSPPLPFSSLMWEQDGLIYSVRFLAQNPQHILDVASSMVGARPIRSHADLVWEETKDQAVQIPNTEGDRQRLPNNNLPPQVEYPPPIPSATKPQPFPTDSSQPTSESVTEVPDTILVRDIKVTGNTVFSEEKIDAIIQEFDIEGKELTEDTLIKVEEVAQKITQRYLEEGYITSLAKPVADQTIKDGVIKIRVLEGRLVEIKIENEENLGLKRSYLTSRLGVDLENPFNYNKLEENLRLLRNDPLIKDIQGHLQPSGEEGKTILKVKVIEAERFVGHVSVDNYSPPSVGSERFGFALGYRNLTGFGDEIFGSYFVTTSLGSQQLNFGYRIPINGMNGTIELRVAPQWTEITQSPFDEFEIEGKQQLYEISYRQPLIRRLQEEFALSFGFTFEKGQTFTFDQPTPFGIGPNEDGVSRTSVIKFGQEYINQDRGGTWFLRSQLSFGTGLFNATTNDPPIPDGHFFSWLGQVQRLQRLGKDHLLIIQADLQLTPDSLLPSQQFIIGGGQSVRGYRQNARSGDNGFRFSIEDRITLVRNQKGAHVLELIPFFDLGTVWNSPGNPNILPSQKLLVGAGLGLVWEPFQGLRFRFDYAIPFINLDDRGNNIQDDGFYFNVNYTYPP
ncbi:MAG: ShlB/FhaC/HecB family hemolysin secretion/activation protein [Moorea sp. SIO2B7]|nr:ShlB/FhaC/HecB family hemolysin secretion/activation protein [Moorena sp. SIO2B7]